MLLTSLDLGVTSRTVRMMRASPMVPSLSDSEENSGARPGMLSSALVDLGRERPLVSGAG